jgi:hypothetical protein
MRCLFGLFLSACTFSAPETHDAGEPVPADAAVIAKDAAPISFDAAAPDAAEIHDSGVVACALGRSCNPIPIEAFPFSDVRDTTFAEDQVVDAYACAPTTDESGPEIWYRVEIPAAGALEASIDDLPGDDLDIDLHLLSELDPASCLARDNLGFSRRVTAGTYYLVADTWVDGSGAARPGPYELEVRFTATPTGACATIDVDLQMFWNDCAPSVPDCFEAPGPDGDPARFLRTPTVGPVVKEAHLVTVDESFPNDWPTSFTDQIERHYQISEAATGRSLARDQPWAPAGEGGSEFGQGSTGAPLPVLDEAWYLNMYWRQRPERGTRMIVRNPANGLTVVASAGYETGPGSNTAIGGVVEEIHLYLGTEHRDELEIGFAADQTLPLGPIDCE